MLQKVVLLSCIDKNKEENLKLQQAMLDNLKMYINPQLFAHEIKMRDGSTVDASTGSWERVNMDFAHQSRTAALCGKPELAAPLAEALAKIRRDRQKQIDDQAAAVAAIAADSDVLG